MVMPKPMPRPIPTPKPRGTPTPVATKKNKNPSLTELAIAFGGVVGGPGGPTTIEERNTRARGNILALHAAVAGIRAAETEKRRKAVAKVPYASPPSAEVTSAEAIDILKKIAVSKRVAGILSGRTSSTSSVGPIKRLFSQSSSIGPLKK